MMSESTLSQLKRLTTVVADTGDFESMRRYAPQDATTNPSLILKAVKQPEYRPLLDEVLAARRSSPLPREALLREIVDEVLVAFGRKILEIVPGRVSTEVDARLSFDVEGTVERARSLIQRYESYGVPRERVLIKIASTWEGAQAAALCERESIHCNLTLMFSLPQAVACAEAGVTLISPFVGRILDYYKAVTGREYAPEEDPGVESVRRIYAYYKHYGYKTQVMGASFRNTGEILELAGCDLLTISPELLDALDKDTRAVERKLDASRLPKPEKLSLDEKTFRWLLNEDAMATDRLADGIRRFAADIVQLERLITDALK